MLRPHASVRNAVNLLALLMAPGLSSAQQAHRWTDRENFGLKGLVRSVRTTTEKRNADPRSGILHKLFVEGHPDWAVFDLSGRRTEFVGSSSGDKITSVSRCTFDADGGKRCEDSAGQQHEWREQRTILPDGSREVTYLWDSKPQSREVTEFDKDGKQLSFRTYRINGKLTSEQLSLPDGYRFKLYDDDGLVTSDQRTRDADDGGSVQRWSYAPDGRLVWQLAISNNGDLRSAWYEVGFKPKTSWSSSLGICRPGLCVDYKFDDEGSGRLWKVVEHIQGKSNLEPDSEEHYDLDSALDEKVEIKYTRDEHGNWITRSVFVWNLSSNVPVEIERDTRQIEYFQ